MASDTAVSLKGVGKRFKLYYKRHHRIMEILSLGQKDYHRDFWALKNIDLEIKRGEALGIIGANGAGKTTLLQIIAGILEVTEGKVKVNGKVGALLDLRACFLPEYTGEQNIRFFAKLLGHSNREVERHFSEIKDFAEIGEFIKQPVSTYSQGMFLRLAFAIAITIRPDIILIDELLAVGDFGFRSKCYEAIRSIRKNATMIVVSHDLNAIKTFAQNTIVLKNGIIDFIGPTDLAVDRFCLDMMKGYLASDGYEAYGASVIDEQVTSVSSELFNEKGSQTEVLKWGEQFKYTLRLEFNSTISKAEIAIRIRTTEGICVSGIQIQQKDLGVEAFGPEKPLIISISSNARFRPEKYFFSILLTGDTEAKGKTLLYGNGRTYGFSVLPDENYELVGLVDWPIHYQID